MRRPRSPGASTSAIANIPIPAPAPMPAEPQPRLEAAGPFATASAPATGSGLGSRVGGRRSARLRRQARGRSSERTRWPSLCQSLSPCRRTSRCAGSVRRPRRRQRVRPHGPPCVIGRSLNTHSAVSAGIASANTTGWYLNPRIRRSARPPQLSEAGPVTPSRGWRPLRWVRLRARGLRSVSRAEGRRRRRRGARAPPPRVVRSRVTPPRWSRV
jgi:hypothetical protein